MQRKQCKRPSKIAAVLLRNQGKTVKVELVPAEQFEGRPGAEPGKFRLRTDGVWDTAAGKWTFYDLAGVLLRLSCGLSEILGQEMPQAQSMPHLPKGSIVKACFKFRDQPIASRTMTKPFQGPDGRWYVFVCCLPDPILIDDLLVYWRPG